MFGVGEGDAKLEQIRDEQMWMGQQAQKKMYIHHHHQKINEFICCHNVLKMKCRSKPTSNNIGKIIAATISLNQFNSLQGNVVDAWKRADCGYGFDKKLHSWPLMIPHVEISQISK